MEGQTDVFTESLFGDCLVSAFFSSFGTNRGFRAIEELRRESKRTAISTRLHDQSSRFRTLTELQSSRETAACWGVSDGPAEGRPEELSEADRAVLRRWKERDEQFDKQVAEIGEAIDRIGEDGAHQLISMLLAAVPGSKSHTRAVPAEKLEKRPYRSLLKLRRPGARC